MSDTPTGDVDLVTMVQLLVSSLPCSVQFRHVKAHQNKAWEELTPMEQANEFMDTAAKHWWEICVETDTDPHPPSDIPGIVYLQLTPCTRISTQPIVHSLGMARVHQHWISSGKYTAAQIQSWDYSAIRRAAFLALREQFHGVCKLASRQAATGKNMRRRGEWDHSKCPRCQAHEEDSDHAIWCDTHSALDIKQLAYTFLHTTRPPPHMATAKGDNDPVSQRHTHSSPQLFQPAPSTLVSRPTILLPGRHAGDSTGHNRPHVGPHPNYLVDHTDTGPPRARHSLGQPSGTLAMEHNLATLARP